MSSSMKIKEEPVDTSYDGQTTVNKEPVIPTNVNVKEEPKEKEADDDDYAWVNDELDFLNEIDYLVVEDDDPLGGSNANVSSTSMAERSDKSGGSTVKGNAPNKSDTSFGNVRVKVEKDDSVEKSTSQENNVTAAVEAALNEPSPADASHSANDNDGKSEPASHIDGNMVTVIKKEKGCDETPASVEDKSPKSNSSVGTNVGILSAATNNNNATTISRVTSTPAISSQPNPFIPLQVKREKLSPTREVSSKSPPETAAAEHLLHDESIPLPPTPTQQTIEKPPVPPPEPSPTKLPPQPLSDQVTNSLGVFPVRIKQERVSPPPCENLAPRPSTSRENSESHSRPKSPKRRRSRSRSPIKNSSKEGPHKHDSKVDKLKSLSDDVAFLMKQREKIMNVQRNRNKLETTNQTTDGQPSAKRRAIVKTIPLPIHIKSEPDADRDKSRKSVDNNTPVDMELDSESEEAQPMKKPTALRVMPQPLCVKTEPIDAGYEREFHASSSMSSAEESPRIKSEKLDINPLSHRKRVSKFIKETIKSFEFFERNPKCKTRLLYTPTILIRENAALLNENRSPLNSRQGIQYEFSSQHQPFNTEVWGICKLREPTAKIIRLLGFNAHEFTNRMKAHKLEKSDIDDRETSKCEETASYFVNASTQTDEMKCKVCIVRKLKRFVDRPIQVSMDPIKESPKNSLRSSPPVLDGVSNDLLKTLSDLAPAQKTALTEFTELILGPAPKSTNDVQVMRERLMDIFTLAQSQNTMKVEPKPKPSPEPVSVAVLFNQKEHRPRSNSMYPAGMHNSNMPGRPIPAIGHHQQQQPNDMNYHPVMGMQQQIDFHPGGPGPGGAGPMPFPNQAFGQSPQPSQRFPQPVPPPFGGQMYDPNEPTFPAFPPAGHPPMQPILGPRAYAPRQPMIRDPRANSHNIPIPRRW